MTSRLLSVFTTAQLINNITYDELFSLLQTALPTPN